ncbi:hypothetical protein LRY60_00310 [Candidatus Woesebacteria bacterium]|nr:hypothetical protein [Candidatus Woesebacteria bacterium]
MSQWFSLLLIAVGLGAFLHFSRVANGEGHDEKTTTSTTHKLAHKKNKKRTYLSLLVIAGTLLLSPPLAQAQTQTEFDVTIQPSVMELSIQPGKRITQAFEIANGGTRDLEVTLSLRDFTSDNLSGTPVLLETNTFPYAELQNADIRFNEPFLLPADSSQQIVAAFDIPITAETRDWYFMLLAETRSVADPNLIGSRAETTGTIGTNVLIRITPTEYLPTDWSVELHGVPKILDSLQSVTFRPLVTNDSTSLAVPDVSVLVLDWRGNIVYEETGLPDRVLAKSTREITAGQQRTDDPRSYEPVPFRFDPLFAIGPYTVRVTLRNNEGGPVVVERGFLAVPISLIAVIILTGGLLWGVRSYLRSKSHTHSAANSTESASNRE